MFNKNMITDSAKRLSHFKHNYVNTLTIHNNYETGSCWVDGYDIKIEFLHTQNLFVNRELYPYRCPNVPIHSPIDNESFKKQKFEEYINLRISELCSPDGIESSYMTEDDFGYSYSRGTNYIKGRAIIWDEYGIEFDAKRMTPISLNEIKSFNCFKRAWRDEETTCIEEFISYVEKFPDAKLYITTNESCKRQDYIAEIVRIRNSVRMFPRMLGKLHENSSFAESLSEHELYEHLTIRQPLCGTLYRELCKYLDFNGIVISWYSEENQNLFHRVITKVDEEKRYENAIGTRFIRNYRWEFSIEGGYSLKQRIKDAFNEDSKNKENAKKEYEEEIRLSNIRYNIKNSHQRDSNISFNESTHQYKVDGKILQSVTNFIEGCFPKFETKLFAEKKAIEMGVSPEEVLVLWEQKAKESRDLGTALHRRIEGYYQEITFEPNNDKAFELFKEFANKVKLKPYRTEWTVYDLNHNIAGTIDFVDFQKGEYIIYDWKRSEKIIENGMPVKIDKYGKKGNYPLEHLDNSTYNHYALQLSLYKYILEKNYGIKISDLRLGIFHPAYDKPYILRMPYLEKEINDIFGLRSEVLF